MLSRKDGISLLLLVVALVLINWFGRSLDARFWTYFTLFANCILVQGVFITLTNVFKARLNRKASKGLILLSLLTGLISFVIIFSSAMDLVNQIFLVIIQMLITYAEAILLRREFRADEGRKI
ncbi:hypothetical protein [Paenibacillus sp. IHB B 3415]|uniref:hypothetical protein n=1 Tax=Paenibacillus sp. IHB B 3415 TaxID=867080 RepID=UPI0005802171|nr:hypothetical protein [Paenibacillus sp. IHB B 3415]